MASEKNDERDDAAGRNLQISSGMLGEYIMAT
jgi:hypothetical protein